MWLLSVNILLICVGLIGALNKSDLHLLPTQSISSHVHVTQGLKSQNLAGQQLSQLEQVHKFGQRNNQLVQFSGHVNQLNQFGQQIQNNHAGAAPQSQLAKFGQLSQGQAGKEISCAENQTINFLKYTNHKLSLNFLNKLTELTVGKLLEQSSTNSSRYNLNFSRPITQLCHEACRSDLECLAFTINTKQSTCYLVKEDYKANNRDRLLFDTTSSWNFYEKVCLNLVPKTAETCNQIWSFDIHPNGHLNNPTNSLQKQMPTASLEECLNLCWTNDNASLSFKCRSVNYDTRKAHCTLNQHNRRIIPEAYVTENQFTSSMDNQIYAENHCVPFQGKCVFRHLPAYYLPEHQIYDVETNVNSVETCEQLCANQSLYVCRAFAYSKQSGLCKLSPEPSTSLINTITSNNRRVLNARRLEVLKPEKIHQQQTPQQPISQSNSFAYYERTSCINVKIDCDANGMHTSLLIDGPFSGRLFTANNIEKCSKSNSDSSLEQINMTIPLDANECGTVSAGNGTFSNRLILQYHPLILKESDRRIEVSCDYHLVKQKVRGSKRRVLEAGGLSASQVITGLAESPPVKLKILNEDKEEVRGAKLGETLFFKVEISDEIEKL